VLLATAERFPAVDDLLAFVAEPARLAAVLRDDESLDAGTGQCYAWPGEEGRIRAKWLVDTTAVTILFGCLHVVPPALPPAVRPKSHAPIKQLVMASWAQLSTLPGVIELSRNSIDVGLVVGDIERALHFYRDLLDLDAVGTMEMPDGGTMHRLICGEATLKVIEPPAGTAPAPGGSISAARGWRYITVWAPQVDAIVARCREAGCHVEVEPWEFRPGVVVGIVADFEGNLVELVGVRPRA